jgi:hypothetical protein
LIMTRMITYSGWHARLRERYARRRVRRSRGVEFETPSMSYRLSLSTTCSKITGVLKLFG